MPTYEYACTSCGQHLEAVQSFTDEPLTTCAVCGGPMRKVFGAIGIVLKGSGFYKNDSRPARSAKSGGDKDGGSTKSDGEGTKATPAKETTSGSSSEGSGSSSNAPAASSSDSSAAKAATP
jgi:putative FmdB family regulatory protein